MKKIEFEKEFLDFIALCNEKQVRYLAIGGYAVNAHGYVRYTKNLDIAVEISEEKLQSTVTTAPMR